MVEAFGKIALHVDVPMVIVTTAFGEQKAGCLVGFTTQCSVDPPRFLICSSQKNFTFHVLGEATHYAVHFLTQEHMELAEHFGTQSGHSVDKFADVRWHKHEPHGVPILDDVPTWFVGRILERHKFGDHTGLVAEPVDASFDESMIEALTFLQVKHLDAGHDP